MRSGTEFVRVGQAGSWFAGGALLVGACSGGAAPASAPAPAAAPATDAIAAPAPAVATAPAPPPPNLASRVFVDVSGSMRGFIQRSRRTVSILHQAIDDSLAEAGRAGPRRCIVGESLECEEVPTANLAYDDPTLYHAMSSRLDSVLRRQPRPERTDPDHPPPPDLLDDAHVSVIVTDGMQAASSASGSGSTPGGDDTAVACQAAADPNCIAAILERRAAEGYGIWLVHQALAFDGPHFAEMPLDDRLLDVARSHADEVALDPRFNGVEFRIGRMTTDARTSTSSFAYRGTKPLLLIVLSRDVSLGRRVTAGIATRLSSQPLQPGTMSPEFATHTVELAPLSPPTYAYRGLVVAPREDQANLTVEQQREVRIRSVQPHPGVAQDLDADVWCGANGAQLFYATYQVQAGADPLPAYVSQELTLEGPVGRMPAGTAAPPVHRAGQSAFRTGLRCRDLPVGSTSVGYELVSTLSLDRENPALQREWWSDLSSTDTYRAPERLYGLRDLVIRVIGSRAAGRTPHGRLRLRIEREEG